MSAVFFVIALAFGGGLVGGVVGGVLAGWLVLAWLGSDHDQ